jgi:cytochrome c
MKGMGKGKFVIIILLSLTLNVKAQDGKTLFMSKCWACHTKDKVVIGPALRGITEVRTKKWLRQMIINGNTFIKSNDKIAMELYNKYKDIQVDHSFEEFKKKEVNAIIKYLETF